MTEKEEGVITRPKVDVSPRNNKPRTMNRRLLLHFVHRNDGGKWCIHRDDGKRRRRHYETEGRRKPTQQ